MCEGVFGQGPNGIDAWRAGRDFAQYVTKYPELKPELRKRLAAALRGSKARAVLEDLFSEIASESDILAMIDRYAAQSRPYDQQMRAAVYAVTIDEVDIRHALFGKLADELPLRAIDTLRGEHGIAANDPRHPDVQSGKPWPEEALP